MLLQNRWLVVAIVSSAVFLVGIDMTVLYTALPRLTHDLNASASQKLWIVNAYPLVMAGLLPGLGTLADRIGHRRAFMIGLMLFGMASAFAAYAWTANVLIVGRAMLAVGAAMMVPATLSLIRLTFTDDSERTVAIGIWGAIFSGAAAVGPIIGGALLAHYWWGSVFLINVPVVLVALLVTPFVLKPSPVDTGKHWDVVGSALIMVTLLGLVYALKELVRPDRNLSHLIFAAMIAGIFAAVFAIRQSRRSTKLIDFSLFETPGFRIGVVSAFVAALALLGIELALSQKLQLVDGLSPLEAGMFLMPIALSAFVAGPVAGLAIIRLRQAQTLALGLLLGGLGLAGFAVLDHDRGSAGVAMLALFGFGVGAAMSGASVAIMLNAPEEMAGMAASIEGVTYEIGGTLGVAMLGSLLTTVYAATLVVPADLDVPAIVADSLDKALIVAERLGPDPAWQLASAARRAFDTAFSTVIWVGAVLQISTAAYVAFAGRAQNESFHRGTRALR